MVSKNNFKERMKGNSRQVQHFGIRKLSIGAASVLLGTTLFFGADVVHADTVSGVNENAEAKSGEVQKSAETSKQATNNNSVVQPADSKNGGVVAAAKASEATPADTAAGTNENAGEATKTKITAIAPTKDADVAAVKAEHGDSVEIIDDQVQHKTQTIEYHEQTTEKELADDKQQSVTFVPELKKAEVTVTYIDKTQNTTIKTDTLEGYVGSSIGGKSGYSTDETIGILENRGYALYKDQFKDPGKYTGEKQNFEVTFVHGSVPVSPTNPDGGFIPGPDTPTPFSLMAVNDSANNAVAFAQADDDRLADKIIDDTDKSSATVYWTTVTNGQITATDQETPSGDFADVTSPTIDDYHLVDTNQATIAGSHVTTDTKESNTIIVHYARNVAQGSVKVVYHDDTTNTDISGVGYDSGEANDGTSVGYTTDANMSTLNGQGYVYVSTDGTIPTKVQGNQDITVTVHMKHGAQEITPNTTTDQVPRTQDGKTVVNPTSLTKKVNLTVSYENSDDKGFTGTIPTNASQTLTFTGTAYVDKVTGQMVNATTENGHLVVDNKNTATPKITWTGDKTSFDGVKSPVEQGYYLANISDHADGNNVAAIPNINKDSNSINVTVTYNPVGNIIPVDKDGHQIHGTTPTPFPNDPNDPTKTTSGTKPEVPGYHPESGKVGDPVDPNSDPSKDVAVVYVKDQGSVTVVFHDDTVNTDIKGVGYNSGTVDDGTTVNYTPDKTVSNLENQGYVYVSTDGTVPAVVGNDSTTVTVHMKHGVQVITPDTPTDQVPKTQDGNTVVNPHALKKEVSLTVSYENSDDKGFTGTIPTNASQTLTFTGTAYVDKVTGQMVNAHQDGNGNWEIDTDNTATPTIKWTGDKTSFDGVKSPVEQGYYLANVSDHADGNNVAAITNIGKDSGDIKVKVTYKPVGSIVPVDKDGKPIPNANKTPFANDPHDPSKTISGKKPEVPGYHPESGNVGDTVDPDPNDPGKDVKVKYVKDQGSVKVVYHDDTTNSDIPDVGYDSKTVDAGTNVDYTTTDTISDLENKGYVYASTDGTIPTKVTGNQNDVVTVHLKHGVKPATKDVTLTINYVNSDGSEFTGQKPRNATQTLTFDGTGYVDKVTKQLVNVKKDANGNWVVDPDNHDEPANNWNLSPQSFTGVLSPAEFGYMLFSVSSHGDGNNNVAPIDGIDYKSDDIHITVTYRPLSETTTPTPTTPVNPGTNGHNEQTAEHNE